jgi:hypothetical protein
VWACQLDAEDQWLGHGNILLAENSGEAPVDIVKITLQDSEIIIDLT